MERRKFIAAMGSLAAGGAAATGTGAFSSAQAQRTVSLETVGDANGMLAMDEGSNTDVAEDVLIEDGNQVKIAFNGRNTGGTGLNEGATISFTNILEIKNQGTTKVELGVDMSSVAESDGFSDANAFAHGAPGPASGTDESLEFDSSNFLQSDSDRYPAAIRDPGPNQDHVTLGTGDSVQVSFQFITTDTQIDQDISIPIVAVEKGGRYDLDSGESYP